MSIFSEADLDRLRTYYPERPGKLSHRLTGHPLLTLEALVELGKRLPRTSATAAMVPRIVAALADRKAMRRLTQADSRIA